MPASSAEHDARVTSTSSNGCLCFSAQRLSGFSLIECLVVNALALGLLSILLVTSADMISAAQKAGDQSEQAIRARQVFDFLESLVKTAQLPDTWTAGNLSTDKETSQYSLMDPCEGFAAAVPQPHWGGIAIVDLGELPCLTRADPGVGLYFERVVPCPEQCGAGAGYLIVSTQCHLRDGEMSEGHQWWVSWQQTMERPQGCLDGAAWGRVERIVLSHRSAEKSVEGVAVLRLQQITQGSGATYRWSQPETMVLGIDAWQLSDLNRFSDLTGKERRLAPEHSHAVRVKVIIGPTHSQTALPSLAIERLLISGRLPPRG
jgi:hypothetical protein